MTLAPHIYAIGLSGHPDIPDLKLANPRRTVAATAAQEKQSPVVAKFLRAENAQQNGFETLGFFAASVVAANVAHVPTWKLNLFCGVFLGARAAFNLIYINVSSDRWSVLRTISYFTGVGASCALAIEAGRYVNAALLPSL